MSNPHFRITSEQVGQVIGHRGEFPVAAHAAVEEIAEVESGGRGSQDDGGGRAQDQRTKGTEHGRHLRSGVVASNAPL